MINQYNGNGRIEDRNIQRYDPLISPYELKTQLPLSERAQETVRHARANIRRVLKGLDNRLLMIVGPCSIHDSIVAKDYACRLNSLRERVQDKILIVIRYYFEKPRTNSADWRGLLYEPDLDGKENINKGLRIARELLVYNAEMGLPSGTEFVDTMIPQHYTDTISWATIGARTVQSQLHRQLASGLSMPTGFKNTTSGDIQVAVDAVVSARESLWFPGIDEYGRPSAIVTNGNSDTHIVLRGSNSTTNYDASSVARALEMLRKGGIEERLMIDCSHGNSGKDYKRQPVVFEDLIRQRVDGNRGIIGIMLESNIYEGRQDIPADLKDLKYGVSVTDACIGWETTEKLVLDAYKTLARI